MDKAQELLAKAQDVVREPLGRFVSMAREKFSLGRLRSVFLFTGVGEGKPFAMPPSHLARAQLLSNLDYYAVNYLALLFLVGVFVCMYYPGFGFWVAALCGGWYFVLFVDAPLVLRGREVGDFQKTAAMMALTVLVVMLWCLWPITVIGGLGAVVVGAHALLRESRTRATEQEITAPMMPKPASVTHLGQSGMNANANAGGQAGEQAGDGSV